MLDTRSASGRKGLLHFEYTINTPFPIYVHSVLNSLFLHLADGRLIVLAAGHGVR